MRVYCLVAGEAGARYIAPSAMFADRTAWDLQPNRFSAALERQRSSGRELLDLTESNPTRIGLAYPATTLEALLDPRALQYSPDARGLQVSREAVAAYYADLGASVEPDSIVLTTSTSEAYSFLFRLLCDPGDEVLVGSPGYPLFDFLASIQDVTLVSYPLLYDNGWQLDLHSLRRRITARTRGVLLVHPNNPTGSYVASVERDQLNSLCAEHELAIIADEVFLDYALVGKPPFTFATNASAMTFTLSGLSKIAGLPQMKLSWMVISGPEPMRSAALRRLEVIADTYLSVGTPVQIALPKLLAGGAKVQRQIVDRVHGNLAELDRLLGEQAGCARLQTHAGWYVVLRVPITRSDEELAIELLERHSVVVHPGHFYDFPQEGYLVLSLICEPQIFSEGVRRLLGCLR